MEVRIENDPRVKLERFMLATVFEGINKDIAACGGGEDGKPGNGSTGDEMGVIALEDAVTAAHGGGEKSSFDLRIIADRRSQVQLGNERK